MVEDMKIMKNEQTKRLVIKYPVDLTGDLKVMHDLDAKKVMLEMFIKNTEAELGRALTDEEKASIIFEEEATPVEDTETLRETLVDSLHKQVGLRSVVDFQQDVASKVASTLGTVIDDLIAQNVKLRERVSELEQDNYNMLQQITAGNTPVLKDDE